MATLMVCPSGGTGGWNKNKKKVGKVSRKLKALVRKLQLRHEGESFKAMARRLAATKGTKPIEEDVQTAAFLWLDNKKKG